MSTYEVKPERHTLHRQFSRDLEPCLTIDPGDTVVFSTLDVSWNLERPPRPGQPDAAHHLR